jgi:diacylglycerol kinase family enzyme
MIIIVNTRAGGGRAPAVWQRIWRDVLRRCPGADVAMTGDREQTDALIDARLRAGETRFVACGGDGTVNGVAQRLAAWMDAHPGAVTQLGAIGAGSSNDFHKPADPAAAIDGVSCRVDFSRARGRDLGRISAVDADGRPRSVVWLLNASAGVTAEANAYFNSGAAVIGLLKRHWTDGAILAAALRSIALHRSRTLVVTRDGVAAALRVTNLGVVKSPHVSGGLRYDSPFDVHDGLFHAHLCTDCSMARTLAVLVMLSRGRFTGRPGTASWTGDALLVESSAPFALEYDGEVMAVRRAAFSMSRNYLPVCP